MKEVIIQFHLGLGTIFSSEKEGEGGTKGRLDLHDPTT